MQCEGGQTIDCPESDRKATTLRKLPTTSPKAMLSRSSASGWLRLLPISSASVLSSRSGYRSVEPASRTGPPYYMHGYTLSERSGKFSPLGDQGGEREQKQNIGHDIGQEVEDELRLRLARVNQVEADLRQPGQIGHEPVKGVEEPGYPGAPGQVRELPERLDHVPDYPEPDREDHRHERRGEGGKEGGNCHHKQDLQVDEQERLAEKRAHHVLRRAQVDRPAQEQPHGRGHHQQAEGEPQVFAGHKLPAGDRFGEDEIDRPPVDLLVNQAGAHEDADDTAAEGYGRQPQILQHPQILTNRERPEQDAGQGDKEGEEHEGVEHPVADGLTKGVDG